MSQEMQSKHPSKKLLVHHCVLTLNLQFLVLKQGRGLYGSSHPLSYGYVCEWVKESHCKVLCAVQKKIL